MSQVIKKSRLDIILNSNTNLSNKDINSTIEIYNVYGQKIISNQYRLYGNSNHKIKFSLDNQPSGIYFLKVLTDKKIEILPITLLK